MSPFLDKKIYLVQIIAIIFVCCSIVWVFFSDKLVLFIADNQEITSSLRRVIGGVLVCSGFLLIYFVTKLYKRSLDREFVFESILGNAVIGLCEFDKEKIIFSNKVFKTIFDFNESDLRLSFTNLVHHASAANLKEAVENMMNGSEQETVLVYPLTSKKNLYQVTITRSTHNSTNVLTGIVTKAEESKKEIFSRQLLSSIFKRLEEAQQEKQLYSIALEEIVALSNADAGVVFINSQGKLIELQRFVHQSNLLEAYNLDFLFKAENQKEDSEKENDSGTIEVSLTDGLHPIGLIRLFKREEKKFTSEEISFINGLKYDLSSKIFQCSQELSVRQNENQLYQLLESLKIAVWYLDIETREIIRHRNLSILSGAFMQAAAKTVLHWNFFLEAIQNEHREEFDSKISQLTNESEVISIECKFEQENGKSVWFLNNAQLFSDEITGKNYVIGISSNIHHLKMNDEIIKNSEQTYKDLFESNPASLLIFSIQSMVCIAVNSSAQFMYGLTHRELVTMSFFDFMPQEDARRFSVPHNIVMEYGFFRLGLWRHKKGNRDLMYVDLTISTIKYKGEQCYMLLVTDVTNEIHQQKEISKSEAKYRQLFERNPQPLLLLDKKLELISDANQTALHFLQLTKVQLVQKSFSEIWGKRMAVVIEDLVFQLKTDNVAKKEVKLVLGNQLEKNVELIATRTLVENTDSILLFMFDITDLKKAEQRTLTAVVEGEEKERERLAKELHDSLGQVLIAASMNLKSAQNELSEITFKRKEQFNKGLGFIQQAIDDTRSIAQNLMPKSISDYGLVSSINQLILSYKDTLGFVITLHAEIGATRFDKNIELNLYRIVQEALTNSIKYAKASSLTIALDIQDQNLRLCIKDNGVGMDLTEVGTHSGIGLKNMSSRVKIMHGELFIDSLPSHGTSITVLIPLEND